MLPAKRVNEWFRRLADAAKGGLTLPYVFSDGQRVDVDALDANVSTICDAMREARDLSDIKVVEVNPDGSVHLWSQSRNLEWDAPLSLKSPEEA